MKKKFTIMTLLAVMLLSFTASSAFASGNAFEPDSNSNPNVFYGANDWFVGTIPVFSDRDYFSWTNDTGSTQYYYVYLYNMDDPSLDYSVMSIGVNGWPPGSASLYFDQIGRECWVATVPNGSTLSVSVGAMYEAHPTSRYEISLRSVPPIP